MKSYKTINLLAIILFTFVFVACKDFLQVDLQKNLTQEKFPTTQSDALAATNAAYSVLSKWDYNRGDYPIDDIMSDDARKGSNPGDQDSNITPFDDFSFTPSFMPIDNWWSALYLGIKRANVVIEKVPAISMDASLRNRYVAEAKFLRAIYYMDLLRAWGNVPLITSYQASPTLGRDSAGKVYQLVYDDLLYAINNLPGRNEYSASDRGRATKGAAQAFLAKAYLYQKDFVNAAKYALDVINPTGVSEYALESTFTDACGANGNYGKESVFEVGSIAVEVADQGGNQYANTQGVRGTGIGYGPNRGWGFNRPSMDLRRTFRNEGDSIRLKGTIIDIVKLDPLTKKVISGDIIDGDTIFGDKDTPDVTINNTTGDTIEVECYSRKVWVPGPTPKQNLLVIEG